MVDRCDICFDECRVDSQAELNQTCYTNAQEEDAQEAGHIETARHLLISDDDEDDDDDDGRDVSTCTLFVFKGQ